jgi:hypothetical protein
MRLLQEHRPKGIALARIPRQSRVAPAVVVKDSSARRLEFFAVEEMPLDVLGGLDQVLGPAALAAAREEDRRRAVIEGQRQHAAGLEHAGNLLERPLPQVRLEVLEHLGVKGEGSANEIKRAYRKPVRKYHLDVSKELDGQARLKEVGEACEIQRSAAATTGWGETEKPAGSSIHLPAAVRAGFITRPQAAGRAVSSFARRDRNVESTSTSVSGFRWRTAFKVHVSISSYRPLTAARGNIRVAIPTQR